MHTNRPQRGFTIVELIIVIIVIGILASVVAAVWTGALISARDKARETDLRTWASAFDAYKARFGAWPLLPTGNGSSGAVSSCLGTPLASDGKTSLTKCVQYTTGAYIAASGSNYTTIQNAVARVSDTPTNSGSAVKSLASGPFVYIWQIPSGSGTAVTGAFMDFFENTNCPSSDLKPWTTIYNTDTTDYSGLNTLLSSLPGGIQACGLVKSFSY